MMIPRREWGGVASTIIIILQLLYNSYKSAFIIKFKFENCKECQNCFNPAKNRRKKIVLQNKQQFSNWLMFQFDLIINPMALTILQNCQKIIIFMQFLTLLIVSVLLTIRLIKKKIDSPATRSLEDSQSKGVKYKDADSSISIEPFDSKISKINKFTQYDNCTQRFMKKICELNVDFNPLLISLPLSFVMGASFSFIVVIYFVGATFCLLFNVFKVHRACIEHKLSRYVLEHVWILLAVLQLINIFLEKRTNMLYTIIETK